MDSQSESYNSRVLKQCLHDGKWVEPMATLNRDRASQLKISFRMSRFRKSAIYSGIAGESGAIIDCGAAIGHETRDLYAAGSTGPFVMVEPFPGNIALMSKANYVFPYTLHKKALNSNGRSVEFFIPQVVDHTAQGRWTGMVGYSSTGYIPLTFKHKAKALFRKLLLGGQSLTVEGITLDAVCSAFEHIRFVKTDLQGAEYEALKGATQTLQREAADMFILEFVGDMRILEFFDPEKYMFYPIELLRIGREPSGGFPNFERYDTDVSSTNKLIEYYRATDPELTMSPSEFIGSFKANFSQCDFLVIHKRAADTFTALVKAKTLITTDIPS